VLLTALRHALDVGAESGLWVLDRGLPLILLTESCASAFARLTILAAWGYKY
jgi:hypothetical protein